MSSFLKKRLSDLSGKGFVFAALILLLLVLIAIFVGAVISELSVLDSAGEEAFNLDGYDYNITVENKSAIEVFTVFQLPKNVNPNDEKYSKKKIYHVRVFDVPDKMSERYKEKYPEDPALTTLDETGQKQILHILTNDKDRATNYLLKILKK